MKIDSTIQAAIKGKTFCISGATGMIGKTLIEVLLSLNDLSSLGCTVIAFGRNKEKAEFRLPFFSRKDFSFIECQVSESIPAITSCDYVIHLASSTHPIQYSNDPIGTIDANTKGTQNMLELAVVTKARFLLASSVEIYGENRGDVETFDESYCGYINCNTVRAGYTESKRLSEAMCQAYASQKELDFVTARLSRVYGPTLLEDDSKALSQFIKKAAAGEDIVLKSQGLQEFSYLYVDDAVAAILILLAKGLPGEAYNVASPEILKLKDIATLCANEVSTEVIFEVPDEVESRGYSAASNALLNCGKIAKLGWSPKIDMQHGIKASVEAFREFSK